PVLFETIGRYEGHPRITKFKAGEIPFDTDHKVEALKATELGAQYLDALEKILSRVEKEEGERIKLGAQWIRKARSQGKEIYLYAMGHLVPVFLQDSELSQKFKYSTWNVGFTSE